MADRLPVRRIDRQRRDRIIDATIQVLMDNGVSGLRHRRVAAQADVPLSATTYYFSSLHELLLAAMTRAVEQDLIDLRERFEGLGRADVAMALTDIVLEAAGPGRSTAVVMGELYSAAMRDRALLPVVKQWDDGWQAVLEPLAGPLGARGLIAAFDGVLQQALVYHDQPAREELQALFERVLDGDG